MRATPRFTCAHQRVLACAPPAWCCPRHPRYAALRPVALYRQLSIMHSLALATCLTRVLVTSAGTMAGSLKESAPNEVTKPTAATAVRTVHHLALQVRASSCPRLRACRLPCATIQRTALCRCASTVRSRALSSCFARVQAKTTSRTTSWHRRRASPKRWRARRRQEERCHQVPPKRVSTHRLTVRACTSALSLRLRLASCVCAQSPTPRPRMQRR